MNGEDNGGRKIREKLENYEAPVPNNVWDSIQQSLPPQAGTAGTTPIKPFGSAVYFKLIYLITMLSMGISIGAIVFSGKSEKRITCPETTPVTEQTSQENAGTQDAQPILSNQSGVPIKKRPDVPAKPTTRSDSTLAQLSPQRTFNADSTIERSENNSYSRYPAVISSPMDSGTPASAARKKRRYMQPQAAIKPDAALKTPVEDNRQPRQPGSVYRSSVSATRPPSVTDRTNRPLSGEPISENTPDKTNNQTRVVPPNEPASSPVLVLPDSITTDSATTAGIRKDLFDRESQLGRSVNGQKESGQLRKDSAQMLPEAEAKDSKQVNKRTLAPGSTLALDSTIVYDSTTARAIAPAPNRALTNESTQVEKSTSVKDSTTAQPEKAGEVIIENGPSRRSRLSVDFLLHGGLTSNRPATGDSTGQAANGSRQRGAAQISGGIRLNYQISQPYAVSSGLLLERMQWQDAYTKFQTTYDSTYQYRYDSLGTTIDSVLQVQEHKHSFSVKQQNNSTYIGIPFSFTYQQQKKRLSYYFTVGVQLNILVSSRSNITTTDSLSVPPNSPDENRFRRVIPLLMGNIGVSYRLSRGISFLIEPRFQYTVSSVYKKQYNFNPHIYTIGVTSGIRLSF